MYIEYCFTSSQILSNSLYIFHVKFLPSIYYNLYLNEKNLISLSVYSKGGEKERDRFVCSSLPPNSNFPLLFPPFLPHSFISLSILCAMHYNLDVGGRSYSSLVVNRTFQQCFKMSNWLDNFVLCDTQAEFQIR